MALLARLAERSSGSSSCFELSISAIEPNDTAGPHSPLSDLDRKRKITIDTTRTPSPGLSDSVGEKRSKLDVTIRHPGGRPVSVSASKRVQDFPHEMLSSLGEKLFCGACGEELSLRRSSLKRHVVSKKHIYAKREKQVENTVEVLENGPIYPRGYEYEFVEQVPEDYFCKLCKHVAKESNITTCCGECFCKACIQDKKPCPSCGELNIVSFSHVKYQRKILALDVRCRMKDRRCRCEWIGQLQHLDAHLDATTGDCQYIDVECPKKCDQKVQKCNVDTHLVNECLNRDYRCPHCTIKATFREISEHFEVCPYYPLACPNRCGATFERDNLHDHMRRCRLEEVQCVFSYAGCQAKFLRADQSEHLYQNYQKHLALIPAGTLGIIQELKQDFDQKLQEQREVFEKKLELRDEQIKLVKLKLHSQQEMFEKTLEEFEARVIKQQTERDVQMKALEE